MTDRKEPPSIIIGYGPREELQAAGLGARLPKHTVRSAAWITLTSLVSRSVVVFCG